MTKRKVYALDLRNHGESEHTPATTYDLMSGDVHNFLSEESIDSCVLIGHSMGGRVGMALSLKYPNLVEQLIPIDVSPGKGPNPAIALNAIDGMLRLPLEDVTSRSQAAKLIAEDILDPSVRSFLLTNLVFEDGEWKWRINLRGIADSFQSLGSLPDDYFEMKYDKPTLFIGGDKSQYLSGDSTNLIHSMFPRAKISMVMGAGHWVHIDQPMEFLRRITNFILKQDD